MPKLNIKRIQDGKKTKTMKRIDFNFMLPAIVIFIVAMILAELVVKILIILGIFFFTFASFPLARKLTKDIQQEMRTKKDENKRTEKKENPGLEQDVKTIGYGSDVIQKPYGKPQGQTI